MEVSLINHLEQSDVNHELKYVKQSTGRSLWNLTNFIKFYYTSSSRPEVPVEKVFLEISQNSQENTCAREPFFTKAADLCIFI